MVTSLSANDAIHAHDTSSSRPYSLVEAESILLQQAAALAESASDSFTKPALSPHSEWRAALDAVTHSLMSSLTAEMPERLQL